MSNETILVVDDNKEIANFVANELLPKQGYQTLIAYNGKTALAMVRKHHIDLIVLDLQLPDITGLEVLRRLASEDRCVPTILATAHGSEEIAVDAFRLGVQDYLIKPVEAEELNAAVTRALTESRLRRAKVSLTGQLKQKITWLTVLSHVGQSITSTLELDDVLRRIVEGGVFLTRAEEGFLALLHNQSGRLYLRAAKNIDEEECKTLRLRVNDSLVGQVVRTGRPVRVTQENKNQFFKVSTGFLVQSLLHVPILANNKVLGVLSVDNRHHARSFSEIDETKLASLANYAAIAIENARLYGQARQEITERRRAETALKRYAAKLEQNNREMQDFVYVASHDLQEPLRKVQAFGGRLEAKHGTKLDDQGRDYLERMQNASARMQTLIDDLLSFSRITTKAQPFEPVDLSQVMQEVLASFDRRIKQVAGRVEVGDLPTIEADHLQMRQLLQNLISNALKFRREDEPLFIKVEARPLLDQEQDSSEDTQDCGLCQIMVTDNGIGFDETYLDRIFQVFQRLHGRNSYEGSGMGLAICRKIVERHGGRINANSSPGKGATFIVTLPFKQLKGDNGQ